MIEKLKWHDANNEKPDSDTTVLLWTQDEIGYGWEIGWWDSEQWWLSETGDVCRQVVTHWSSPEGPNAKVSEGENER